MTLPLIQCAQIQTRLTHGRLHEFYILLVAPLSQKLGQSLLEMKVLARLQKIRILKLRCIFSTTETVNE